MKQVTMDVLDVGEQFIAVWETDEGIWSGTFIWHGRILGVKNHISQYSFETGSFEFESEVTPNVLSELKAKIFVEG